jgi:predicted O-methyltransferase YrrM
LRIKVSAFFELQSYLRHLISARGPHGIHSPFVFELITRVLEPTRKFYDFDRIEHVRNGLLRNKSAVFIEDLGAGSRIMTDSRRTIASIATHSLQSVRCAQHLFRMVHHFSPHKILELGTSLGITTSYLALASKTSEVFTIEGSNEIAALASEVFQALGISNVRLTIGSFENRLQTVLEEMGRVDLALVDGNHRYDPTMDYCNQIMEHIHEDSMVVLDDIHWSPAMARAWDELLKDERVMLSLDFFHFGILFFKNNREKEHFTLRLP